MSGEGTNPTVSQERAEMPPWALHWFLGSLLGLVLFGLAVTWATKHAASIHMGWRRDAAPAQQVPREVEGIDMTLYGADLPPLGDWDAKRLEMSKYQWVDRAHGTIRIPIERAMQILVKQGHVE